MKRFKQSGTGLAMALGMFAMVANAGETVSSAAGGWFAVDSRDVKDTTLEGGVIVGGKTGIALTSSANAWGEDGAGTSATITWASTSGGSGTVASATTAEAVAWTPEAKLGTITLTYVSGGVEKTAQFGIEALGAGGDTYAQIRDGVCTIGGTGATRSCVKASESPPYAYRNSITNVIVCDGVTGIGDRFFENFWNLADVTLAASVTDVGARAFKKCYGLTNVVSLATGGSTVGNNAFTGCFGLQQLTFAGSPDFGAEAYTMQTAIVMHNGYPEVYAIPQVTVSGKTQHVMATNNLKAKESEWVDVTDMTAEERSAYHFFKIVLK